MEDAIKEIYESIGRGYSECTYHRALEFELRSLGISYESEKIIPILYKGQQVGYRRADLVLNDLVIELKAVSSLSKNTIEIEQITSYMEHLGIDKGMIINFGNTLQVIDVNINENGEVQATIR